MDRSRKWMTLKRSTYTGTLLDCTWSVSVGGNTNLYGEATEKSGVESDWEQILVVVANILAKSLKTEVEKGSLGTVVDQGLVGPKSSGNSVINVVQLSVHRW